MICSDCKHIFYDDIDGERYCRRNGKWDLVEMDLLAPDWCPINAQNTAFGVQNGVQNETAEPVIVENTSADD